MLSLTLHEGKSLFIGDDVIVKIKWIKGNKVRVGVEAPHTLSVHREEIYDQIGPRSLATGNR